MEEASCKIGRSALALASANRGKGAGAGGREGGDIGTSSVTAGGEGSGSAISC